MINTIVHIICSSLKETKTVTMHGVIEMGKLKCGKENFFTFKIGGYRRLNFKDNTIEEDVTVLSQPIYTFPEETVSKRACIDNLGTITATYLFDPTYKEIEYYKQKTFAISVKRHNFQFRQKT